MSYWMEESQHQNDIYMGGNYIEKTKQTIKKMRATIRQCKNLEGIMRTKCEEGRKKCPQIKLLRFTFTHYVLHISPTSPIYSWSSTSSRTYQFFHPKLPALFTFFTLFSRSTTNTFDCLSSIRDNPTATAKTASRMVHSDRIVPCPNYLSAHFFLLQPPTI